MWPQILQTKRWAGGRADERMCQVKDVPEFLRMNTALKTRDGDVTGGMLRLPQEDFRCMSLETWSSKDPLKAPRRQSEPSA